MNESHKLKGIIYAATGAIGWGLSGVCSQYLFAEYNVSSTWLTSVRMVLSGIILLAALLPKERTGIFKIWKEGSDRLWLIAFAILGLLLCQYSFFSAIKFSNSGTATVLQSLNVVLMAIVVAIYNRTRIGKLQGLALLLAILGTFLITTGGNPSTMVISPMGLACGLLSAVGVITYTLLSRVIIRRHGNILVTGWGMLIGGICLTVLTKSWYIPSGLDAMAFLMLAIIVIIGTAIGFSIFLQGVHYIGPVKATLIGCLEPASATVLSVLFLGTTFTTVEIIGFIAIIATVFLSIKENKS